MVQYLKTRLIDINRGTSSQDVLVFKCMDSQQRQKFMLFSNAPVNDSWRQNSDSSIRVIEDNTVRTLNITGEVFSVTVGLHLEREWMSLTTWCAYLDQSTYERNALLGNHSLDPVSVLTHDPSQPFDFTAAFTAAPASSSSRTSSPEVARTEDNCVAMLEGYTRNDIYTGFSSYHHNQRAHRFNTPLVADKPWRIGIELEVYARSGQAYNTITSARSNWFQCESDGSLIQADYPIELKTIPLRACDAKSVEFWDAPMRRLGALAKSKGYTSTGLHVHIGKEILGNNETERQETLNKLCWFYVYRVENVPAAHAKNVTIAGRERGYAGELADSKGELADFAELVGYKAVVASKPAFDKMAADIKENTRRQRWDINLGPYDTYGTIEFRKGDGRISKTRIAALVTWWEQMTLYCRNHRQDQLDFDDFFSTVCAEYPAVAYFFNVDEEV